MSTGELEESQAHQLNTALFSNDFLVMDKGNQDRKNNVAE